MNDKGQMNIGLIVVAFVAVIIGLAIYSGSITSYIGATTQTQSVTNHSFIVPALGSTIELYGQNIIGTAIVGNSTKSMGAYNYTIYQGIGADGLTATLFKNNDTSWGSQRVNATYAFEPDGYVSDGGARAITLLIPIMVVLAIALAALYPALKERLS